ncbi:hypothetical protein U472_14815 [Orenia metallireducens]|uniref:Ubiquitin-like domain-containing protein n=1 Tax=Orenia metallireducens TaxID=1413210 RepID=A0A1C0A661_9FIRM|nr:DUF3084 domain-containing protein [Orenia metallireducens]OCL25599.1 hypothetical protein U472_14815 [Orenia metallireducens]
MYGIKLLLALVIVAGTIAYVGDKIGMKIGKKRLSLFGLRPKHTSIVITVGTGILIALASLLLLMGASKDVRMALFDMEAMLERLSALNQSLVSKNNELLGLRSDIEKKVSDLLILQEDKDVLESNLTKLKKEYQVVQESKLELEDKVEKLTLQKSSLTEQVDNLAYNISLFGRRYLSSLTGDIVYQKGEIIIEESIDLEESSDKIENKVDNLLEEADRLARQAGIEIKDNKEILEYNIQELNRLHDILKEKKGRVILRLLSAKNTFKDEVLSINFDLYEDYKVYHQGDTILMANIQPSDDLSSIERELYLLLDSLNKKVISDGLLVDSEVEEGEISLISLYPIIDKLLLEKKSIKIEIVAIDDIWRSDNLRDNIEFKISGDDNDNRN